MKQNELIIRFSSRPIEMEGGVLQVKPLEGSRVLARVRLGGEIKDLAANVLSVPYPSALRKLKQFEPHATTVLVERIPPGLKEAAKQLDMNYLDLNGRGRIVEPDFVYVVPPALGLRSPVRKARSSPFAQKSSRIVRALLSNPTRRWRLSDIADEVGLNPGNVHRGLSTLVEDGYVERDGDLYVLVDPGSLLETWADLHHRPTQKHTINVNDGDLSGQVRSLLVDLGPLSAVSGELGAELAAPHLPAASALIHCADPVRWASLKDRDDGKLSSHLLEPTSRGKIAVCLSDEGALQFGSKITGFPVVSPAQLYVDLYRSRNRARQAAEEVRSQLLGF